MDSEEVEKMLGSYGEEKHFTSTTIRKVDRWWVDKNYASGLPEFIKKYVEQEIAEAGLKTG